MPASFPDGIAVTTPPLSQVSQAKEDRTATPVRCYVCLGNPAQMIPIGGHLGQVLGFCSERCAAIHGLRVLRDSEARWCASCSTWTEENGVCHLCGVRWTLATEHAAEFCNDLFNDGEGVSDDA